MASEDFGTRFIAPMKPQEQRALPETNLLAVDIKQTAVPMNSVAIDQPAVVPAVEESSAGPVQIHVLRSVPELESIRDVWTRWQWHPNSDFDHYNSVLQSLRGILRPHVIVAYRNCGPIAILVGRLEHSPIEFSVGYKVLFHPRVRKLTFIHAGFLGEPSPETAKVLVDSIDHSLRSGEACAAYFNQIRTDSALYQFANNLPGMFSRDRFPTTQTHRSMRVPDSIDAFYQTLSPKVRKNQRWQAKKLIQDFKGNVRIDCISKQDEFDRMFRDLDEIAKKTYQRGLGAGFIPNKETRQLMQAQSDKGQLRTYILYIEDKPCAFWIAVVYGKTFHSSAMGYDPNYAKYSPGMFLIMKVIEGLCVKQDNNAVVEIDFGLGDAQYKQILGTNEWQEATVYLFSSTMKGRLLSIVQLSIGALNHFSQKALKRTQLLGRVKRYWRDRLSGREG